jgi:anti-sigma regulatory factor (Ser/Thr protein kinase)
VRQAEAEFTPDLASARAARRFVASVLEGTRLPVDMIVLLVSELATNAVLHARTDFTVRVEVDELADVARVEVEDANERPPSIAHTPAEATSGRGLQLVQALAESWGVEGRMAGKLVWFELSARAMDNGHGRDREAAHHGVPPGAHWGAPHRLELVEQDALAS